MTHAPSFVGEVSAPLSDACGRGLVILPRDPAIGLGVSPSSTESWAPRMTTSATIALARRSLKWLQRPSTLVVVQQLMDLVIQ